MFRANSVRCLSGVVVVLTATAASAQTSFTYQGQLKQSGAPLNAAADFQFSLFTALTGGSQVGTTQTVTNVSVANGLFTTVLDFGAAAFNGQPRWLQIAVRSPAGSGSYTTLTPRQQVTATPYAVQTRGIFVDAAGKVGIGTTVPLAGLDISRNWDGDYGPLNLIGDRPTMRLSGGTIAGNESWLMHVGSDGPGALQFFRRTPVTGIWANHMTILPNGSVGIGGTPTSTNVKLQVVGGTDAAPSGGGFIQAGSSTGANVVMDDNEIMARSNGVESTLFVNHNGGNVIIAGIAGSVGNVGIGTTNPAAKLDVNGTMRTQVLEITGADVAEKFPCSETHVPPGTVMEIDADHPGQLRVARQPYSARVAGVVSGANSFAAGAILGNLPGHDAAPPIALSGRVYVRCDASTAAIEPGDLLTTSATPGHAMKASDTSRAAGAVLGKAMTRLERGKRGLVLVLVTLQ